MTTGEAGGGDGGDGTTPALARVLRLPHATAMVVGTIIGTSIFVQPSEITSHVPSLAGTLLVWIAAGVLTACGALVCAELASMRPEAGGVYVYLREAFHPALGFLWGWAMFWTMHSGIIAAIATVFARYTAYFVALDDTDSRIVAVGAVLALSCVNYVGVRQGSNLQTWFTAAKVLAIVVIVIVGLALGSTTESTAAAESPAANSGASAPAGPAGGGGQETSSAVANDPSTAQISLAHFLSALVAGLFAFGGWHMVTYNAEETADPRTTIPRALVLGVAIVTACYLALNTAYFRVLPVETIIVSNRVAADAADAVLGFGGGAFMSALVMFSAFGALAGIILAGPRVYFAMARDRQLPAWIAAVHPRFRTPHRAIVAQAIWASALAATGSYRALFTRVIYTEWIFFGLMAIGLLVLRRRSSEAAPFRIAGGSVIPLLFALSAFAIVLNQLLISPRESAIGLGFVLLGLPVYTLTVGRQAARE